MKIIDAHTHCFPDELAARAIPFLEEEGNIKAKHNGTIHGLLENMKNVGIEKSVVLSIATKPSQSAKINEWAVTMTKQYKGKLIFSGSVHQDLEDSEIEKNIKYLAENNVKLIKLHPEYQYICPLNNKMDRIYRAAIDYDVKIFFHSGRDIAFVGSRSNPKIFLKLIKKYPKLKVILAHLGSWLLWNDVYEYLAGEEIYFDTSFTLNYIEKELFLKIIEKHNKNLILFGTDSPWENEKNSINKFNEFDFNTEIKEKILYQNSEKLFFS
ncbi:MAG TPA: amidohydrolase family protein [bacterium]|nr:amidohydrolase family protein [bacterium]